MTAILTPILTVALFGLILYAAGPKLIPIAVEKLNGTTQAKMKEGESFQQSLNARLKAVETELLRVVSEKTGALASTQQAEIGNRESFQQSLNVRLQALETELGVVSEKIVELASTQVWGMPSNGEKEAKATELVKLAEEFKRSNPGKAALYYWAALEASPRKKNILNEYIVWQESLIDTDIKNLDFTTALDRLTETVALVDANLYKGSLEDLRAFDELGGRLAQLGNDINQAVDTEAASQTARLDAWATDLKKAAPDQKNVYEKIIAELEQFESMPQNEERLEEIQNLAMNYLQTCEAVESLLQDRPTITTPTATDKSTAERWLSVYIQRLASKDISLENRLSAIEEAQMYLSTVTADINSVLFDQLEKAQKDISIALWKQESSRAIAALGNDKNPDTVMAALGSLYAQGQTILSEAPDEEIRTTLTDMTQKIYLAQLAQVRDGLTTLQNSAKNYEPEILQQLAAQHRMQAASIAMEFQDISAKLSVSASSGVEDEIKGIIIAANQITDYFGNKIKHVGYNIEDKARENFQNYFDEHLTMAESACLKAEIIAEETFSTWGNERAQVHLIDAYKHILHHCCPKQIRRAV